jgi:uncharacterized protein (TIGR02646 family)
MIFVDRTTVPAPDVLTSDKAQRERERITRLLSSSKEHLDQVRVSFESRLYIEAKPALRELFHNKCAYCESPLGPTGSADVEHFRPKQGAETLGGVKLQHYYAWLATEWENLLLACAACGRRYTEKGKPVGKGSLFPVVGERAPVFATVAECRAAEKTLLLDPCFDRPEEELEFDDRGACVPRTERGRVTIELLHLNREALTAARLDTMSQVRDLVNALVVNAGSKAESVAQTRLADLLSGRLPYTGAARAAFAKASGQVRDRQARVALQQEVLAGVDAAARANVQRTAAAPKALGRRAAPVRQQPAAIPAPPTRFKGKLRLPRYAHELIRRVEIRNFKAIEELTLDFPEAPRDADDLAPAVLLLGENACGKSTILEAIALTLLGTEQIETLGLDGDPFIRRASWEVAVEKAEPAEVAVYFTDDGDPVRLTIDPKTGRFRGARQPSTVVLAYGPRRFFTDRSRKKRSAEPAEQVRTMFDPLAVIENPTSWLMHAEQDDFNAAVRALRQILLLADEALVARPPEGKRKGQQIMFEVQGDVAPLNRLSEGYKTIVATGVDVMRELLEYWPDLERARGVVLIDELETHLHPRWKMRIVNRLRRAMPQVQWIATTHDPLCLRGLYEGEAQVLQRDSDKRIEKLVEVPNVRGLSVEQLLTSEYFGLFSTEDPRLEDDVARYAALAAKRDRTPDDEAALAQQRANVESTITVGAKPADQLIHQAANEYLVQRSRAAATARPTLKREAINRVVDIWKSLEVEEDATP